MRELIVQWCGARGDGISAVTAKIAMREYEKRYPQNTVTVETMPYNDKFRVTVRTKEV